jgi:hypothetical protein
MHSNRCSCPHRADRTARLNSGRPRYTMLLATLPLLAAACQHPTAAPGAPLSAEDAVLLASAASNGLVRRDVPAEDPGPPFYARVTRILDQYFHHDGWLAIPFYRSPDCVPTDFDLLGFFDPPGPNGPGAFACPILMGGFSLIEPDAPLGTFPKHAVLQGDAVPFWFVRWADFTAAAADGHVTIGELAAMQPLKGLARHYQESLQPREGEHRILITARGTLEDGRSFDFHVTHSENETKSVRIRFR